VKADPKKADSKAFKQEKEEKVDWKALARDERTWKITGAVFLLIAIFLFIAFLSYFFTWKEDQDIAKNGFSALQNDKPYNLQRLEAMYPFFYF
jgi:S-DNA-T family DNA segregation ATPase FtsK/SpoIIIE